MGAEPRDAADAPVRPGCWLACDNRPGRAAHMVTAVHGGRVWFGDHDPPPRRLPAVVEDRGPAARKGSQRREKRRGGQGFDYWEKLSSSDY